MTAHPSRKSADDGGLGMLSLVAIIGTIEVLVLTAIVWWWL
jgi:hypothetical protein